MSRFIVDPDELEVTPPPRRAAKYSPDQSRDSDGRFGSGGGVSDKQLDTALHSWFIPGPVSPKVDSEQMKVISSAIEQRGEETDKPLYRGMRMDSLEAAKKEFTPGKTVDLPPSSFSGRSDLASRYAMEGPWGGGDTPVFVVAPSGTQALDVSKDVPYMGEQDEQIVAGRFVVDKVETQTGTGRMGGMFSKPREWSGLMVTLKAAS